MESTTFFFLNIIGLLFSQSLAFMATHHASIGFPHSTYKPSSFRDSLIPLKVSVQKLAAEVNGEELEIMLTEWEQPLVVDAFATWCGPCLAMAPEFEEAAKELEGKVRFVKLDTDKEPDISARLNIMAMPTLLFLNENEPGEGEVGGHRFEGAVGKDSIIAMCEHYFFGAPFPEQL